MKKVMLVAILLFSGCIQVGSTTGPAAKADITATAAVTTALEAKLTGLEARLNTKISGVEIGTFQAQKLAELTTKIGALENKVSLGNVSGGQVNAGAFSGGGVYVTIAFVALIVCILIFSIVLLVKLRNTRKMFGALKDSVKAITIGKDMIDKEMKNRGFDKDAWDH
jgi:hypothetical protein